MNWGKWIIVTFVLFAVFIGTLVTVCVRQDISLVSKNYYQEELAYQGQIQRLNNAAALENRPVIRVVQDTLEIEYAGWSHTTAGRLTLFRPSDARLDRSFELKSSADSTQRFDMKFLPAGMYKVKLTWTMNDKEYFVEDIVNL
jgi:hypothetical protein